MDKDKILKNFNSLSEEEKPMLLELFILCKFSDDDTFENYFRIEELNEDELFRLISFLYHQDCFLLILDILNKHKERFVSHSSSFLEELDFSEQFMSRLGKLKNLIES